MTIKWLVVFYEWKFLKKVEKQIYFDTFGQAIDFFNGLPIYKKKTYPTMEECQNDTKI